LTLFSRRTIRNLAIIVAIYALPWLPAIFSTRYLDSALGLLAAMPVVSIYLFDMLGVPGLLAWGFAAVMPGEGRSNVARK
jgi:hypothetical protein